jgi:Tfp pilus assembly protein PilX
MVSQKKQNGSVLVFTLIILSFLLVASLSLAAVSISEKRSINAVSRSVVAFQIADSGLEKMLERTYKGSCNGQRLDCLASSGDSCSVSNGSAGVNGSINNGSYRVTFIKHDGSNLTSCSDSGWRADVESMRSEGVYSGTARAVKIDINPI